MALLHRNSSRNSILLNISAYFRGLQIHSRSMRRAAEKNPRREVRPPGPQSRRGKTRGVPDGSANPVNHRHHISRAPKLGEHATHSTAKPPWNTSGKLHRGGPSAIANTAPPQTRQQRPQGLQNHPRLHGLRQQQMGRLAVDAGRRRRPQAAQSRLRCRHQHLGPPPLPPLFLSPTNAPSRTPPTPTRTASPKKSSAKP